MDLVKLIQAILALFKKEPRVADVIPIRPGIKIEPKLLSVDDWITSSGKYPERAKSMELTDEVKANAKVLIDVVNQFLQEIGIDPSSRKISSGFRPSEVNAAVPGSAKKSLHMSGLAVDIADPDNSLDAIIEKNAELLDKYGLWLESPKSTAGWCHLDKGTRSQRKIRIFMP